MARAKTHCALTREMVIILHCGVRMISLVLAAIGLVFFFCLVLYLCVRNHKQDLDTRWDSGIEMMRKSPFGRWRY
jgi:uncharacterized membrane protein